MGDEPMFSRNIPSAFSITSCPSDKEELSFSNSSPEVRPGDFDNSMLYIEEDGNLSPVQMMDKLDIGEGHKSDGDHEGTQTPSQVTYRGGLMGNTVGLVPTNGWITGLLSCFNWNIIGKGKPAQIEQNDWEIPFENISDLEWLGSGAQGAVFVGKYKGEAVAVKKVKEEHEVDIKHLRKLNHPNIVQFRGVCTQSPVFCIVMEYCPYGPLFNLLREGKEVPPKKLVEWTKQIATGMSYLHQHKIIHRDLKSPNILIGRNDIIKISDFGTSRQWSEHTPRYSASTASLNGNSVLDPSATPGSTCECPGCPGNPGSFPPLLLEQDMENRNLDQEDYLDTLDRKVNEIMNRDCSRR